jgi:AcrR family transcriptional regulator
VRDRILQCAIAAMVEKGYHGTSMRDIAARVQCSVSTIYDFYAGKNALLVSLIDDIVGALNAEVRAEMEAAETDMPAQLAAAARGHVRVHAARPAESFLAASEIRSLEAADRVLYLKQRDDYEAIFRRVIADGVRSGDFTTPYPLEAARAVLAMCTAVASWFRPGGSLSAESIADRYAELALSMVGWTGTPGPGRRGAPEVTG